MPLKIIYVLYTLPFLALALVLYIKGMGAFGRDNNVGIIKKVLFHLLGILLSYLIWRALAFVVFKIDLPMPQFYI